MKMEVEIGLMHLRGEDSWRHQNLGQKHGTGAPSNLPEGTNHADILTSSLLNYERIHFCCFEHQVCDNLL